MTFESAKSEVNHRANTFSVVHQLERFIDLIQLMTLAGNKLFSNSRLRPSYQD